MFALNRFLLCPMTALCLLASGNTSDKALLEAIQAGNSRQVSTLLHHGANPSTSDVQGVTALMYSALYSDATTMRRLLRRGANPNAVSVQGATALMWAAGDPEKVGLLISSGADVNVRSRAGRTALSIASAEAGAHAAVAALLQCGADVNAKDADGIPVISYAGASGDPITIRTLLEHGADANVHGPVTPLSMAVASGDLDSVQLLLDHKADASPKHMFLSPLLTAIIREDVPMTRLLLEHGADPNDRGASAGTPLMWAAYSERGDPVITGMLLHHGADPRAAGAQGETPLTWAQRRGATPITARLQAALAASQQVAHAR